MIGPDGGVVEENGPCFFAYGPEAYWRSVNDDGHGGALLWTNAFRSDAPSNWARWTLNFAAAGSYRVEAYVDGDWGVYENAEYQVRARNRTHTAYIDQSSGNGWVALGDFDFRAGGRQWVDVFDNADSSIPSDQHIAVDAIRLSRLGCGEEVCNGIDDDCDGVVPPDELDNDDDGVPPCGGDCDDSDPNVWPGAEERCNGIDDDCDDSLDDERALCGTDCGNLVCEQGEDCATCPDDCGECDPDEGVDDHAESDAGIDDAGSDDARSDVETGRDASQDDVEGQVESSGPDTVDSGAPEAAGDGDDAASSQVSGSCGCRVARPGSFGTGWLVAAGLLAFAMGRRGRKGSDRARRGRLAASVTACATFFLRIPEQTTLCSTCSTRSFRG